MKVAVNPLPETWVNSRRVKPMRRHKMVANRQTAKLGPARGIRTLARRTPTLAGLSRVSEMALRPAMMIVYPTLEMSTKRRRRWSAVGWVADWQRESRHTKARENDGRRWDYQSVGEE